MALDLGFGDISGDQIAPIIRKIIDTFPWMIEIAECKFDPDVVNAGVVAAAQVEQAKAYFQKAIKNYEENRVAQKAAELAP